MLKGFSNAFLTNMLVWAFAATAAPQPMSVSGSQLLTSAPVTVASGKRGLVVIFLSARCPCSDSHVEEIRQLAKLYSDFQFLAVHSNQDEDSSSSQAYFAKTSLPFPILQDNGAALANRFKAFKTPHAFVFDQTGKKLFEGGVSDSHEFSHATHKYLREALEDISKGAPVRTAEARTLGCIIQR